MSVGCGRLAACRNSRPIDVGLGASDRGVIKARESAGDLIDLVVVAGCPAINRLTYPNTALRGERRDGRPRAEPRVRVLDLSVVEPAFVAPPSGAAPAWISTWPSRVFSREAKRRSRARVTWFPVLHTRPRIAAMLTTGARARRMGASGHASSPVGPRGNAAVWRGSCSVS